MVWPLVAATVGGYVYAKSGSLTPDAEDIGEAAGEAAETIMRGIGPALVGTIEGAYEAVQDAIKGREADAIAAITIGIITVSVGFFVVGLLKSRTVVLE